jgi:hypothetical protein
MQLLRQDYTTAYSLKSREQLPSQYNQKLQLFTYAHCVIFKVDLGFGVKLRSHEA